MTNPFAVLIVQAIDNYNKAMTATHTLPKALLYTFGTSIFAAILYRSLLRGAGSRYPFLSVFMKPLDFIFGSTDTSNVQTNTILFEDKYFKEYDEWVAVQPEPETCRQGDSSCAHPFAEQDHRKECLENMYYSTVRETIDDFYGEVMMCYDHATSSFAYYARTANIPYKYLETISRKYMIETNAPREIHVDIRDEYNKAKDRNTAAAAAAAPAEPVAQLNTVIDAQTLPDKDVFVKLKSYNTVSNLNLHTTTNDKTHKFATGANTDTTPTNTTPANTPGNTNKIIREKANRYSYRGKIADFERRAPATTATPATTTTASDTTTGYAEFKKQWKTTKSAL